MQDVTSVDFSAPCVELMRSRNAGVRPSLRFQVADCRDLRLGAGAYDVILEKGLLDAMVCGSGAAVADGVRSMVDGVVEGLAPGGAYVLVSFAAPADRLHWVDPHKRGLTTDIWTLAKPGAMYRHRDGGDHMQTMPAPGEEAWDDDAPPQAPPPQRFHPGDDVDGTRHFVYVFTKPAAGAQGEPSSGEDHHQGLRTQ